MCTDEWQTDLGVDPTDAGFHECLQQVLYRHALTLLRSGTNVILEDGLWTVQERTEKFTDARACGARIDWHVFDVDYDVLWARLQRRNHDASPGVYPITEDDLRRAWALFQAPSSVELSQVDSYVLHRGDAAQATGRPAR